MIEQFRDMRTNRHQLAMDWKDQTGGKVVGTFCCNVPSEIVHAAGMLPVRILGEHEETTEADLHYPTNVCPFPKSCFDQALKGEYDYLDGIVVPNVCDIIRATFGFWKRNIATPYAYFLEVPQKISEQGTIYFADELRRFARSLGDYSGQAVTDKALWASIALYNESRSLLQRVYQLKRQSPPAIRGSEAQAIVISAMIAPKEQHNQLLMSLLGNLEGSTDPAFEEEVVRLFVSSSMLDDDEFLQVIEECGASAVADDSPTGTRYFRAQVDTDKDPYVALAERYLSKVPCPRKMLPEARFEHIERLVKEGQVQGVIVHNLRACDCHLYEYPYMKKRYEELGLPVLFFKGEETEMELEQQKSDIEAFVEMIRG